MPTTVPVAIINAADNTARVPSLNEQSNLISALSKIIYSKSKELSYKTALGTVFEIPPSRFSEKLQAVLPEYNLDTHRFGESESLLSNHICTFFDTDVFESKKGQE